MVKTKKTIPEIFRWTLPAKPAKRHQWEALEKSVSQTCAGLTHFMRNTSNKDLPKIISGLVSALHREVE